MLGESREAFYLKFGLWATAALCCGALSWLIDRKYPDDIWWAIPAVVAVVAARRAQVAWEKK